MKKVWITYDEETGRLNTLLEEDYGWPGYTEIEVEDDWDVMKMGDYAYRDGELVYTGESTAMQQQASEQARYETARAEQVLKIAMMQVATMDMTAKTDTDVADVYTLLQEWIPDGHEYKQRDAFQWNRKTWRVSQNLTSQSIYPPDCSEALYYEIKIAPDGIIVYRQCTGQHDAVAKGERRHYPNAEGPVYESLVEDNAYSPDVRSDDWRLVDGQ